jgi:hypothetical protein
VGEVVGAAAPLRRRLALVAASRTGEHGVPPADAPNPPLVPSFVAGLICQSHGLTIVLLMLVVSWTTTLPRTGGCRDRRASLKKEDELGCNLLCFL